MAEIITVKISSADEHLENSYTVTKNAKWNSRSLKNTAFFIPFHNTDVYRCEMIL